MRDVTLAATQFEPAKADTFANLARARQHVFEAFEAGARLVVLPELSFSGVDLDTHEAAQCAQVVDGYQTEAFVPLCRMYDGVVIFGCVELSRGNLYNSAVAVDRGGPLAIARKINLEGHDFMWASPGDDSPPPIFIVGGARVGILVAHDVKNTRRASSGRDGPLYRKGSVDVLCVPSSFQNGPFPSSSWMSLAESLDCNLVVANALSGSAGGHSAIVSRDGHVSSSELLEGSLGGVAVL